MLSNRLRRRLRDLRLDSYAAYYDLLRDPKRSDEELPHFLSAVTTNETYFFRNTELWRFFQKDWIPKIAKEKGLGSGRSIRIWSAACSSGEEAYTAAICLREKLPNFSSWKPMIIGTDISERVLEGARTGAFNDYSVSKTPAPILAKWFDKRNGSHRIKPELKKFVSFRFHNLRDPLMQGKFDFIFLRNVLMYFDTPMKKTVIDNVSAALAVGGVMVVGDVDPIRNTPELYESLTLEYDGPNRYRQPKPSAQLLATSKAGASGT